MCLMILILMSLTHIDFAMIQPLLFKKVMLYYPAMFLTLIAFLIVDGIRNLAQVFSLHVSGLGTCIVKIHKGKRELMQSNAYCFYLFILFIPPKAGWWVCTPAFTYKCLKAPKTFVCWINLLLGSLIILMTRSWITGMEASLTRERACYSINYFSTTGPQCGRNSYWCFCPSFVRKKVMHLLELQQIQLQKRQDRNFYFPFARESNLLL